MLECSTGYGVLWDNYSTTNFSDAATGTVFDSEIGDCADYYLLNGGGTADGVVARYRSLTGQAPMFPRWTLGFWQSKERYKSQDETVGVVEKYRALGMPPDGIVQDWQDWGKDNDRWNDLAFNNPKFPNPQGMVNRVHALHAHQMISVWPSFGRKSKPYQELASKDMLFDFITWPRTPHVKVYDAFDPDARDIYRKYLNQGIFKPGGWTPPSPTSSSPLTLTTTTKRPWAASAACATPTRSWPPAAYTSISARPPAISACSFSRARPLPGNSATAPWLIKSQPSSTSASPASCTGTATSAAFSLQCNTRKEQYTSEKAPAPLEIRVYPGVDGEFTLYEDGNYNYEKGVYATIKMRWNDKVRQLTFEDRAGTFAGMQGRRTFRVLVVDAQHGPASGPTTRLRRK